MLVRAITSVVIRCIRCPRAKAFDLRPTLELSQEVVQICPVVLIVRKSSVLA